MFSWIRHLPLPIGTGKHLAKENRPPLSREWPSFCFARFLLKIQAGFDWPEAVSECGKKREGSHKRRKGDQNGRPHCKREEAHGECAKDGQRVCVTSYFLQICSAKMKRRLEFR